MKTRNRRVAQSLRSSPLVRSAASPSPRAPRYAPLALVTLALVLGVAGTATAWAYEPVTPIREKIDALWGIIFWTAMVIFVGVEIAILYVVFKFRGNRNIPPPEKHRGNNTMEIVWTAIPALILILIGAISANTVAFIDTQPEEPDIVIKVKGSQWLWVFEYPDGNKTNNMVRFEAGKTVRFDVESTDVNHAFNAPELGMRIDAVPTRTNQVWTHVSEPGTYQVYCTEYCGLAHAYMTGKVVVFEPGSQEKPYGLPPNN